MNEVCNQQSVQYVNVKSYGAENGQFIKKTSFQLCLNLLMESIKTSLQCQ